MCAIRAVSSLPKSFSFRHRLTLHLYMSYGSIITETFETYLPYLLNQFSRFLLEKLTGSQLVKKFPAFYGTGRFITAFTSAHHLSLS